MISSTAFPKVAFSKPPILGPVTIAKLSVALPINPARAIIVKQYTTNIRTDGQCNKLPTIESGTPIKTKIVKIRLTINPHHSSSNLRSFLTIFFTKKELISYIPLDLRMKTSLYLHIKQVSFFTLLEKRGFHHWMDT